MTSNLLDTTPKNLKGHLMTKEEIGGIIRTIASAGFGMLVGKGYLDAETALALSGAIGTIAVAVWSVIAKRRVA